MNGPGGWKDRCARLEPGLDLDACFAKHASDIDAEVSARANAQSQVNSAIKGIQNDPACVETREVFGKSVDNKCVNRKIAAKIRSEFSGATVTPGDGEWQGTEGGVGVNELLTEKNVDQMSSDQLRTLYSNLKEQQLAGGNLNEGHASRINGSNGMIADQLENNLVLQKAVDDANADRAKGLAAAFYGDERVKAADVVRVGSSARENYEVLDDPEVTHTATYVKDGKKYILGLKEQDPTKKYYSVESAMVEDGDVVTGEQFTNLTQSVGTIRSVNTLSYSNKMLETDATVRYYETEPYKGMPAYVPIDSEKGWYAATRQSIPAFGGIGAFDKSGRVTSFWLCNVGDNGRAEFNSGVGDDTCQMINTNTGQPIGSFPGLSSSEATSMVTKATQCVEQAARQYGSQNVNVCGATRKVGSPMADVSDSHCADFMSPKDCLLLFNVCDPVICPPSRCNLGGTYNVADVVQTGIIGSTFLCLPNIKEGVVIPVCLTGIHAGIDGLISIMRNYRDCLQENLETGEMVGICDQIYSIYLCEFFWNQVAPFVNVIIPKLIELAYGQGTRGGAEYLSVMSAWQNMENSVEYFTQSYAVNSLNAFRTRSVQEVGTEVCKGFMSVKAPTAFEALVEPDSPPQFHAWFSSKSYTTTTVPATSQYKVFYHIYSGNDQGTTFSVYLRSPPDSSYYSVNPTVGVDNGFIPPGEYASQTIDFTAPEGYQELCVRINNDEHCDFKQVSSSFAVNYLRDEYVQSELENSNIQSEEECISGGYNPGALLNPNLQAGFEETIDPAIYNRGVVRICSTSNPGQGTDPGRFVRVGNCGDLGIGCWLDEESVDRALTDGNVGARNESLTELGRLRDEYLDNEQGFVSKDEAAGELQGFESELKRLRELFDSKEDILSEANQLLNSLEFYEDKVFYNSQRAHLLVIEGDVYKLLAMQEKRKEDAEKKIRQPGSFGDGEDDDLTTGEIADDRGFFGYDPERLDIQGLSVKRGELDGYYYRIYQDGVATAFYLTRNKDNSQSYATLHKYNSGNDEYDIVGFADSSGRIEISVSGNEDLEGNTINGFGDFMNLAIEKEDNSDLRDDVSEDGLTTGEIEDDCNLCGDGLLNSCDIEECSSIDPSCAFEDNLIFDNCFPDVNGDGFDDVEVPPIEEPVEEPEPITCESHLDCLLEDSSLYCENGVCEDVENVREDLNFYTSYLEETSEGFREVAPESTVLEGNDFYLMVGHTCSNLEARVTGGSGTFDLSNDFTSSGFVKLNDITSIGRVTSIVKCKSDQKVISINVGA
jgi:hypothetical protein